MKNSLSNKYVIAALVVLVLLVVAFNFKKTNETDIGTGQVVRQDFIQRATMAGTVVPVKKTVVMAPYNGYIKKLFVKTGDKVKVGDPLVSVVQSLQNSDGAFPLRSPLDGTVVQVGKEEGEFAKEGDLRDFILRIDDNKKFEIKALVPEIDRVKLKVGQEAIIKVAPILDKTYKGIIKELALAAVQKDEYSRSQNVEFLVIIEMLDSDDQVKSGMSTVIDVITHKKEKILMLGHEYIRQKDKEHFVILPNGKKVDIQVGVQNEEGFEILSGLNEGQQIKQIDFSEIGEE